MGTSIFTAQDSLDHPQGAEVGDVCEVVIDKLVYGGDGLGHVGRQAVFVPLSAPGDRLRIHVVEVERNFARGTILEILDPSPLRRVPPCDHFGDCGGCQLQHLTYEAQVESKRGFVRESLRRIAGLEWTLPIDVVTSSELGYRSRAEIKVSRDGRGCLRIGYFKAGTHEVCDVHNCPILLPAAERELHRLRHEPGLIPADATRVYLTAGDEGLIVTPATGENDRTSDIDALGTAHQKIGGFTYGFGVRSFFQANRLLVGQLVDTVVSRLSGKLAVDLYAGTGLFTFPLASQFESVIAVEGNRIAANHGIENARANNVCNVRYEQMSVEAWLKYKTNEIARPDVVLLDPPRAGMGRVVIERLAALQPHAITYVSCDPTTLARDLRLLIDRGYALNELVAVDMFPQTFHVETVARLSLMSL
jgi:23S rRNA (uracil1939-C5)-methyltransferase